MPVIQNHVLNCPTVDIDELQSFQKKLKQTDNDKLLKLRKNLINNGITFPFFVWKNGAGKDYLIDGNYRAACLRDLRANSYDIPEIPVVYVTAKNQKEATKIVVLSAATYSRVTKVGLAEFTHDLNDKEMAGEMNIQGLNLDSFGHMKVSGGESHDEHSESKEPETLAVDLLFSKKEVMALQKSLNVIVKAEKLDDQTAAIIIALESAAEQNTGEK